MRVFLIFVITACISFYGLIPLGAEETGPSKDDLLKQKGQLTYQLAQAEGMVQYNDRLVKDITRRGLRLDDQIAEIKKQLTGIEKKLKSLEKSKPADIKE